LHGRLPVETIAWEGKETLPGPRKQAERLKPIYTLSWFFVVNGRIAGVIPPRTGPRDDFMGLERHGLRLGLFAPPLLPGGAEGRIRTIHPENRASEPSLDAEVPQFRLTEAAGQTGLSVGPTSGRESLRTLDNRIAVMA
jgi:hypothetical protein